MRKVMRHSIIFGGVLSLVLIPAFAGEHYDSEEGKSTGEKGRHGGWFQKLDEDGDGKVSQEEFQNRAEEKFDKMDGDGDGSITEEEWREAVEHWKEKHKKGHDGYRHGESKGGGEHDIHGGSP